ncbi:MAG: ImpA domain protein, partial [Acidobacteria bacterium]|nr:ImpA domain protein [Acidobacteriota bacterium]
MPLRDDLLNPISGENPGGESVRYAPIYDRIKEARREDDDAPQGEWQRERKTADHALIIKLAGEALATKSKDLQLAVWLTESLLKTESFAGLRLGLD